MSIDGGRFPRQVLLVSSALLLACSQTPTGAPASQPLTRRSFEELMNTLASAWNAGDAAKAAGCFTEDAVYMAPPSPRVRKGRQALFEFFGGAHGRPRPMTMRWHHLLFDEDAQIGSGEYTFEYELRTHGVVMVRIVGGKIARWREYEVESPLDWEQLAGESYF